MVGLALLVLLVLAVMFIFVLPVWAWNADTREQERARREAKEEAEAWLAEQQKLPKYRVEVLTKTGDMRTSRQFEPEFSLGWRYGIIKQTSLENAQKCIEASIAAGRYFDEFTLTYIPTCEIERLRAVIA